MPNEIRKCQNCKKEFTIEPEDFEFYQKINVPPPTWCPECRLQRRTMHQNERVLYKGICGLCHKNIISFFAPNVEIPVYCNTCWWSDKWDPMEYGQNVDFSRPFLKQLKELSSKVPWPSTHLITPTTVKSEYCNICSYLKNCYLLFNSDFSEDCAYSSFMEHSKSSFDMFLADYCELCYEGVNIIKCNRVFFSVDCQDCYEVSFSRNLIGCSNCFGCINLRNKQYYIFNNPYSKEEYFKRIKKLDLGSQSNISEIKKRANKLFAQAIYKYMHGRYNTDVSGDYIYESKRTFVSYQVLGSEDSKFCHFLTLSPTRDSYDFTMWGGNATRMYECMGSGGGQSDMKFCYECWANATSYLNYCMLIKSSCSHLFGCIGLKNKQYCILNKQYTKEEYEKLVPKIIEHMNKMPYVDKKGRVYKYGEFFPPELSLSAYNETIAQEYFPLTKEQALAQGYRWKDPEERDIKIDIKTEDLPDHIKDVDDSIIGKVIQCAHAKFPKSGQLEATCNEQCTTAFKIIEPELQFYKRMNLPLPRLCPNCRHYQRLKQRNPLKLWHRKCQCAGEKSENGVYKNTIEHFHGSNPCPNEFETTYVPERPEIVYCEKCYLSEVV